MASRQSFGEIDGRVERNPTELRDQGTVPVITSSASTANRRQLTRLDPRCQATGDRPGEHHEACSEHQIARER